MNRNQLIQMVERLDKEGGFAQSLGQACLYADETNLAKLLQAFPEIFDRAKPTPHLRIV